jgi:hypothetical protein
MKLNWQLFEIVGANEVMNGPFCGTRNSNFENRRFFLRKLPTKINKKFSHNETPLLPHLKYLLRDAMLFSAKSRAKSPLGKYGECRFFVQTTREAFAVAARFLSSLALVFR